MASHSKLESAGSGEADLSPDSYASEPTVADGEYPTRRDALTAGDVGSALADDPLLAEGVRDRDGGQDSDGAEQHAHATAGSSETRTTRTRPIYSKQSPQRAEATKDAEDEQDSDTEIGTLSATAPSVLEKGPEEYDDDEAVSLEELLISDADADEEEEEDEATDIHAGLSDAVEASLGAERGVAIAVEHAPVQDVREASKPAAEMANTEPSVAAERQPAAFWDGTEQADATVGADEPELGDDADPPSLEAVLEESMALDVEAEPASVGAPSTEPAAVAGSSAERDASAHSATPASGEPVQTVEPARGGFPSDRTERETLPETVEAKRRDAPLPSFDIPDLDTKSLADAAPISPTLDVRGRVTTRPMPLPPLSEIAEDDEDDDAVTHIGLPVTDAAANDHPAADAGFQVAAVAALQSLDGERPLDPRRATTRVIPRFDPKAIPARPVAKSGPGLTERLQALAQRGWDRSVSFARQLAASGPGSLVAGETGRWRRMEDLLPRFSMVLLGSGIGAVIVLFVVRPEHAAQPGLRETQTVQALQQAAPGKAATLTDRARAGDGDALYKITSMPLRERASALTLALEAGYQSQKLREFKDFAKSIRVSSGPLNAAAITRFVDYASSPETMLATFQELTEWASPSGPDVLYAVWERAPGGSRAASLAQQLLYSGDQRSKATPALVTALDLRSAASCDDYLRVLPAVLRTGDQRCSATLRAIEHTDGCGGDGQQDCYACLRHDTQLKDALAAVQHRPGPTP